MEFGVENFDNSNKTFNARNTFLGIEVRLGTALVGRNDTVFKSAEGSFDLSATPTPISTCWLQAKLAPPMAFLTIHLKLPIWWRLMPPIWWAITMIRVDSNGDEVYSKITCMLERHLRGIKPLKHKTTTSLPPMVMVLIMSKPTVVWPKLNSVTWS